MAAPAPTVRTAPLGIKLREGYQAYITFAVDPDVSFWEIDVMPPGFDGGEPIPQTTMFNIAWHTKAPRRLKDMTGGGGSAAYDPNVVNNIISLINVATTVTVGFSDGSTLAFYGYLKSVKFQSLKEGVQPTLDYTFECTNYDPTNNVEAAPVLTSTVGT